MQVQAVSNLVSRHCEANSACDHAPSVQILREIIGGNATRDSIFKGLVLHSSVTHQFKIKFSNVLWLIN